MNDTARRMQQYYQQADRLMLGVLAILCAMSFALSNLHNTLAWAAIIGVPTLIIPAACIVWLPGTRFTRCVVAVAVMVYCALHIHQSGGMTEVHFGVFVLLSFLLCYRDWTVILTAAVAVALHHLSFNFLQEFGYGVLCFTHTGLDIVLVHAAYVVAEAGVLIYLSIVMDRQARQEVELAGRVEALSGGGEGRINLVAQDMTYLSTSARTLNLMLRTLHGAISDVREGGQNIHVAAQTMVDDNAMLAQRTETQLQNLQETAEAVSQYTEAVQQNHADARQADALATQASTQAQDGGTAVSRVVEAMDGLHEKSRRIVDIISVIDGIAFQTNILALNAAVEAARAGEQGRGFAVVASEVRALAQRSAAAAREIGQLIGETTTTIANGSELASEAGRTMNGIVESIREVSAIMARIVHSSDEQSRAVVEVKRSVEAIDQGMQQNAEMVQAASGSAASMLERAAQIAGLSQVFELDKNVAASASGQ
ncbi:methyl-accepting chemotaxis protein [Noviherbaspirillum pedocola]|uniref:Chemotaxis protein n=1 Tax=Noviherbaspirillum pedocola TaxID=2801341 RepID=A0A934ST44_9BURK|nr:methyl-accepting chemotaxis protein [Noviherbaspirillum pedocola]MBK4736110.1 chemotaxis protein [Noviherbaspirillum pedocola]